MGGVVAYSDFLVSSLPVFTIYIYVYIYIGNCGKRGRTTSSEKKVASVAVQCNCTATDEGH